MWCFARFGTNCTVWKTWKTTAWKLCKYGVISGPYVPVFGLNTGKYGQEITPYLHTFYAENTDGVLIFTYKSHGYVLVQESEFTEKKQKHLVFSAEAAIWSCSQTSLRNTPGTVHFTVEFGWLIDIRVKWFYCLNWISVSRCFCCQDLVTIALVQILS